jgi:D-alanyl-D-alanine carboxypeptidase
MLMPQFAGLRPWLRRRGRRSVLLFLFLLSAALGAGSGRSEGLAAAGAPAAAPLAAALDAMLAASYPAGRPGAAVLVRRGDEVLVRKGYGMANLELGVALQPESVFEIGSITKQFTAAGILLLAERGRLHLDDEVTRYLPDFPTHGKKITLQHLLTHTSGIADYTHLPEWAAHLRDDMQPAAIVALFKDKPLDFSPGERFAYDNSGYFLLGMVIEKASGKEYGQFMMDEIFRPLGMKSSRYGSNADVILHRANGYEKAGDGFANAHYHSMTQPYAAGALVSDVDDLALWDRALYGGPLFGKATLARMFTPGKVSSGASTRYANGWAFGDLGGHALVWHNGGIPGFETALLRAPDQRLLVVVLSNDGGHEPSPDAMARRIAAQVLGVPEHPPILAAGALDAATLDGYVGVYVDEDQVKRMVTRDGDRLFAQRQGGEKAELQPTARDRFVYKDNPAQLSFQRDAKGRVSGALLDRGSGPELALRKNDEAPPPERQAIAVAPALAVLMEGYAGAYEITPAFVLTITRDGDHLFAQATGQPRFEIFPASETRFFLKVVDAEIEFTPAPRAGGRSPRLVLHQGGRDMTGERKP